MFQAKQTYTKTEYTNSILQYFEYFCQKVSKSILIILSYAVSKLVRFLRHSEVCLGARHLNVEQPPPPA